MQLGLTGITNKQEVRLVTQSFINLQLCQCCQRAVTTKIRVVGSFNHPGGVTDSSLLVDNVYLCKQVHTHIFITYNSYLSMYAPLVQSQADPIELTRSD